MFDMDSAIGGGVRTRQLPASVAFDLCLSKLRLLDAYHSGADRFPDYDPHLVAEMFDDLVVSMECLRPYVSDTLIDTPQRSA